MAGISIRINDADTRASLERLIQRLYDTEQPMREIGAVIDTQVQLGFRAGKDPEGRPWAPLSPVTIARRSHGGTKPLRDTGRLQNSFSTQINRDSVEYGTNVEYASTHQGGARKGSFGTSQGGRPIPWGDIPQRAILPADRLPAVYEREIRRVMMRHIERLTP
jgi:phage virion morphogenesis protein